MHGLSFKDRHFVWTLATRAKDSLKLNNIINYNNNNNNNIM